MKIINLSGKSASGKDLLYRRLLEKYKELKPVITHTTRPMRSKETDGVEYHFIDKRSMNDLIAIGDIFEHRTYFTEEGEWVYGTSLSEIDTDSNNVYIAIVDLDGLQAYREAFGYDKVVSYYIDADDDIRLIRALKREVGFNDKKKDELIRRFFSDDLEFRRASNVCLYTLKNNTEFDLDDCIEIIGYEVKRCTYGV